VFNVSDLSGRQRGLDQPLTWITFHRVRFLTPINGNERHFDAPMGAAHWIFGPDSPLNENGLRTRISDVWGGAAFYTDRSSAEAVIDDPIASLPYTSEVIEAWHALLCPISHRGETTWFGQIEDASRFKPAAQDPGGALVVMTSAGFDTLPPDELKADLPRRIDFSRNVDRVIDWYGTLPGKIVPGGFQPVPLGPDGMTFSLWRDDAAMAEVAYKPGIHRTQLDRYKAEHTADRSSFTRARLLRFVGNWNGDKRRVATA
jgi:hypothetical protein